MAGAGSEHQGRWRHGSPLRPQGHGTIATGSIGGSPLPASGLRQDYDKWCHLPKEGPAGRQGDRGNKAHLILDAWELPRTNWPEGPIMDFFPRQPANDELARLSSGFPSISCPWAWERRGMRANAVRASQLASEACSWPIVAPADRPALSVPGERTC